MTEQAGSCPKPDREYKLVEPDNLPVAEVHAVKAMQTGQTRACYDDMLMPPPMLMGLLGNQDPNNQIQGSPKHGSNFQNHAKTLSTSPFAKHDSGTCCSKTRRRKLQNLQNETNTIRRTRHNRQHQHRRMTPCTPIVCTQVNPRIQDDNKTTT